ncbi:MAG: hypothetical protein H6922_01650 [Pseudomonadaceae bacterium]|nr:hypothetical protein [Pseudomonadaceae bacterium]
MTDQPQELDGYNAEPEGRMYAYMLAACPELMDNGTDGDDALVLDNASMLDLLECGGAEAFFDVCAEDDDGDAEVPARKRWNN